MATAVEPTATPPARSAAPASALVTGALGAAVMLVGIAAAAYAVPQVWGQSVGKVLEPLGGFADALLRVAAQVATLAGFAYLGGLVMGANPPKGTRGAIGLIVTLVVAVAFLVNAVAQNLQEVNFGLPVTLVVLGVLVGASFRLLTSQTGQNLMVSTEEQGWFSLFSYKPAQGLKARRYTLIGLLLVGWTGIYSLMNHTLLNGDWVWHVPFTGVVGNPPTTAEGRTPVTLLTDIGYTIPVLLAGAVFWLSWRAVNVPTFADFLIATEVEMNKVSWSSRKRLIQDTVVVLVFVILMTLFLMVVDFFWGWLLSREAVGVLPPRTASTAAQPVDAVQGRKLEVVTPAAARD